MGQPKDPDKLELVRKAIIIGQTVSGCCEWRDESAKRIDDHPPAKGLSPHEIKSLLCEFVRCRGEIVQVGEKREEYHEFEFYYRVVIPVQGLCRGLFVEMILVDDDADFPVVFIVNAHEQGR